jgi:hypothetical protein
MKTPPTKDQKPPSLETDEQVRRIRPLATATIDAIGPRQAAGRGYGLKLVLELNQSKLETGPDDAMVLARKALEGFAPAEGMPDRRSFQQLSASRRGKGGVLNVAVVAIEATVTWPDRPAIEAIEILSAILTREGYKVIVQERRECTQPSCSTEVMTDWRAPDGVPSSWFSASICGKHNYKQCARCRSVYMLNSTNAAGQSPSVHCEVCGQVLIEWGSSKRWDAELVTRGEWTE